MKDKVIEAASSLGIDTRPKAGDIIYENIDAVLNRKRRKRAELLHRKEVQPRQFCYALFTNDELKRFFTLSCLMSNLSDEEMYNNFVKVYEYVLTKIGGAKYH